jgi:hypothetical protein
LYQYKILKKDFILANFLVPAFFGESDSAAHFKGIQTKRGASKVPLFVIRLPENALVSRTLYD